MDAHDIQRLFEKVRSGRLSVARATAQLRHFPFEDLSFAKIDHHRALRQGFAEVIYAQGKTPQQVVGILRGMLRPPATNNVLITRADSKTYSAVRPLIRSAKYHPLSKTITVRRNRTVIGKGAILVVAAGTCDIPVAEEAVVTAETMGNRVESLYDVGVAGLHRLLSHQDKLAAARVIVCVAGMEGALVSVVAGLVGVPVIAVPTSIGYGTSFGGLAAMMAMLNSCTPNVTVVNIDNGFGAGYVAATINRL